jgi:hypothetical protein
MNYKNALQERGLNVENLSKSLQGQITKLEADYLKITNAESEELGLEELAVIEDAKKELQTVDEQITEKILKFNPELQRRREENMSKAIATRMANKENPKETPAPAPKVVELAPKVKNNVSVKEKLEDIKKEIEEQPIIVQKAVPQQRQQNRQPQPQKPKEDPQEFERVEVVKKKRNGVWFAVVGISALALTWGAVNIFKNNK